MNTSFLYFIHLNLCISLLLALTVLILGLETADHYRVCIWCTSKYAFSLTCSGYVHLLLLYCTISFFVCLLGWWQKASHYLWWWYMSGEWSFSNGRYSCLLHGVCLCHYSLLLLLCTCIGIPLFIVAISVGIRHDLYGTNN